MLDENNQLRDRTEMLDISVFYRRSGDLWDKIRKITQDRDNYAPA